jgi:hypothetical protein
MLCRACKDLSEAEKAKGTADPSRDHFVPIEAIKAQVDVMNKGDLVSDTELLDMCDTEGNHANGGGSFDVKRGITGHVSIRWNSDSSGNDGGAALQRAVGAPGEIGSPSLSQGPLSSSMVSPYAMVGGGGAPAGAAASR